MRTLPLILGRPSAECAPLLERLQALCQPLVPSVRPPEELQRIHLPGPDTVVLLLGLDAPEIVRCLGRLGTSGGPRRILVHCDQRERSILAAAARSGASLFSLAELIALDSSVLAPGEAGAGGAADASIHRLLRDYNHFLRNRLSTLEQIVALLADQLERDPAARTWMRRLEREMKRIESTTERLLELSSPLPTEVEAIDPLEVFQHVAETTKKQASASIEFRFEPAQRPLPRVRGQRELAAAVATEVLQNAAAHALRSAIPAVVRILFTPLADAVEVRVLHSGAGIPATDAERALAPFFTTEDQGSGLGLTIARRFLAHMGGSIALEAHDDRGHFPVLRFALAEAREEAQ
ncbi:MAG: HAMP domain-containing histidine kinase [Planctomycetes bacterium]|nr:HAMP domain-containing histidine kinase [Planctomycetota bacterium]